MTIAACYLSPEGVVLAADSTTTMRVSMADGSLGGDHYYNFGQKIYEVGERSTLGIIMWGLGSMGPTSYRTMIAQLADGVGNVRPDSVEEIAERWRLGFWSAYQNTFRDDLDRLEVLAASPGLNDDEAEEYSDLARSLQGGFCIGGRCDGDRTPRAYELSYDYLGISTATPVTMGVPAFWGVPTMVERVLYGIDLDLISAIEMSSHWTGSDRDLYDLVRPYVLGQPSNLPLREAIDYLYSAIYTTIKSMKFSHWDPICGGPVEVAVITTDRAFRWVRHKPLDDAIGASGQMRYNA